MNEEKIHFKIWAWEIIKHITHITNKDESVTADIWYSLDGVSDQYQQGRFMRSSKIIRLDFEKNIVETINSVYELQDGLYPIDPTAKGLI